MSEIRVLFLGTGNPPPTFIKNRILQLDNTGNVKVVVLASVECIKNFILKNGIVLPELPICFSIRSTILPLIFYSLLYPFSTLRLWLSLDCYPFKIRLRTFIKYHSLVRVRIIDIVHFQWVVSSDEIGWARKFFKVPVIISARGSQLTIYPVTEPDYELKIRSSLKAADYIHAVSQGMADACIRHGADKDKIFVNYNGFDIERFKSLKQNKNNYKQFHLISTGTLMWRKGYLWQLILVKLLKEKGLKVKHRIIGDGPDRQGLQYTLLKLGLAEDIILEGHKPQEELINYLGDSDVYISTSAAEGLSNAVLEAVASGLPVVAFDCEGMNEIIDEGYNGFIVPFGDIISMAEKVRLLYSNRQLLETMGLNGALIAAEKFDYKIHVQKMIEFYKTVCNSDE